MKKDIKDLKERTKQFALKIIRLVASLPRTREADIIGRQLVKQEPRLEQTIENPIVLDRRQNFEQKSVLLSRNRMNRFIG